MGNGILEGEIVRGARYNPRVVASARIGGRERDDYPNIATESKSGCSSLTVWTTLGGIPNVEAGPGQ